MGCSRAADKQRADTIQPSHSCQTAKPQLSVTAQPTAVQNAVRQLNHSCQSQHSHDTAYSCQTTAVQNAIRQPSHSCQSQHSHDTSHMGAVRQPVYSRQTTAVQNAVRQPNNNCPDRVQLTVTNTATVQMPNTYSCQNTTSVA